MQCMRSEACVQRLFFSFFRLAHCTGIMDAGISQENGAAQDITFEVNPGEVFVVPQGLLHHNHNNQCIPNVYLQSFTSSDPGALNVINALATMRDGSDAGFDAIKASGAVDIVGSDLAAFQLDQHCLKRCGFPETGAPGDGLDDLPDDFKVLFGLDVKKEDDKKYDDKKYDDKKYDDKKYDDKKKDDKKYKNRQKRLSLQVRRLCSVPQVPDDRDHSGSLPEHWSEQRVIREIGLGCSIP